ncbi:MAG: ELM1/GtrOC1 family putative glycosyltransferase, partial [Rhodospirillaceae bacterium]|nr:ELM1/GtrOC1 family putative glycosyltransferase [Rhodospirillaceae bacterium]
QRPYMPSDRFDLVVAPRHDGLDGANVHVTRAAVHRVTAERLAAGRRDAAGCADPARHAVTVLIGGSNRRHRLTEAIAARFGDRLAALCRRRPIDLRLTPSRRTPPAIVRILVDKLAGTGAQIWDGSGDNPYFDWLAIADTSVVT